MRIIHTSDWHLGQTLHGHERTYEHDQFLDWLLQTLVVEQVDALLVAGDLFDSSNPPASCQRRLFKFLAAARVRLPHLNIVMVAGNHDSAGRLEAPSPLLESLGIVVIGQPIRLPDGNLDLERMVVPLTVEGRVSAWCLAVPFLRPGDVPRIEATEDPYAAGIAALYRQTLEIALSRCQPGQAIVAMGHCHLVGGKVSELSERRIVIGGAEAMPVDMFGAEIAYVALGHLHLAQSVGTTSRRYSGSPLPLSFGEADYPHQVMLVDLAGNAVADLRELRVPRAVEMLRIPAEPAPIDAAIAMLAQLELPAVAEMAWPYLEIRVVLDAPAPDLRARIEAALADKPVRLARIETRQAAAAEGTVAAAVSLDELERLEPADIFIRIYREKYGEAPPAPLLSALTELMMGGMGTEGVTP